MKVEIELDELEYYQHLEQEVKSCRELIDKQKFLLKEQGDELKKTYSDLDRSIELLKELYNELSTSNKSFDEWLELVWETA